MYAEGQEAKRGQCSVTWVKRSGRIRLGVVFRKEPKRYVGSWVEGFGWLIFVGVDGFAYGKTGS